MSLSTHATCCRRLVGHLCNLSTVDILSTVDKLHVFNEFSVINHRLILLCGQLIGVLGQDGGERRESIDIVSWCCCNRYEAHAENGPVFQ